MGDCMYYMKAVFPTYEALERALPEIKKYIKENRKAGEYWHANRDKKGVVEEMRKKFPLVMKYAKPDPLNLEKTTGIPGPEHNALSGMLIDGEAWDETTHGKVYTGATLSWHMASWDHHMQFFKEIGAKTAVWASEEDTYQMFYLIGR